MNQTATQLSIIIPALNEACSIGETIAALARVRGELEIIVVDGGSVDATVEIARQHGARVLRSERGRGLQMHTGAVGARGEALLFLHADTTLPPEAAEQINEAFARDESTVGGNCRVRFDGEKLSARFLTWLYPQLRKIGLCYGDSAIFVRASVYQKMGGFKSFPLFEDLDFIRRLRNYGRVIHLPVEVVTSSRRFEHGSFVLAFARWSTLQGLYWLGVHPRILHKFYAPVRRRRSNSTAGN